MNLWLDDERPAPDGWFHARSYDEAVSLYNARAFDVVSLDHDLGGDKTGYDFLCFIEERIVNGGDVPEIRLHTANPVGRQRMQLAIDSIARRAWSRT